MISKKRFQIINSMHDTEISETLDEVSVSTTFVQSRLVSVSTTKEIPSLDESRSRQPQNFPVSMSLGLDTTEFPSLDESQSRQPQNFPVSMSLSLDNHRKLCPHPSFKAGRLLLP